MTDVVKELTITRNIMKYLKSEEVGGFWYKTHGSPFQIAGLPDIIGCYLGHFFAFEVKTAVGRTTPLQNLCLENITDSHGTACVVRSVADVRAAIAQWHTTG